MRTILIAVVALSLLAGNAAALLPPIGGSGGICIGVSLDELLAASVAIALSPQDTGAIVLATLAC